MELDGSDRCRQLALAPGDVLALISDGIYEFPDARGKGFGEQRVAELFTRSHGASVETLADTLIAEAIAFGTDEGQADDITLVLLRRLP